jgi:hypothetical protein
MLLSRIGPLIAIRQQPEQRNVALHSAKSEPSFGQGGTFFAGAEDGHEIVQQGDF